MIRVRQNSAANLLIYAPLGKNSLALLRMLFEGGMDFPIEIVQQRRERPFGFVFSEFAGIGGYARLDRQRVLAQAVGLRKLAQQFPSLFAGKHCTYDNRLPQLDDGVTG